MLRDKELAPNYIYNLLDADMAFCRNMREKVSKFFF